jgi:hypothetical protein
MKAALVTVLTMAMFGCTKSTPPPRPTPIAGLSETQQCVRDLRKLQAAANIGTNQLNYDPLLISAKASCDEAERKLPDGKLKIEIDETIRAYVDAYELWSNWQNIFPDNPPYEGWKTKYGIKSHTKKYNDPMPMTVVSFDPDECVPVIWTYAAKHLDDAARLLDTAMQE